MEKYEFGSIPMEYILENPELYIIPEYYFNDEIMEVTE